MGGRPENGRDRVAETLLEPLLDPIDQLLLRTPGRPRRRRCRPPGTSAPPRSPIRSNCFAEIGVGDPAIAEVHPPQERGVDQPTASPLDGPGGQQVRAERTAEDLLDLARRPRAAPRGRSRSSMPISSSIETRSSVAMLPVEPGGTGQPPSSPKLDSNESIPCPSAASTLARPWPRVLWKCAVSSGPPPPAPSCDAHPGEEPVDLERVGHAGRVAEADLGAARCEQALGDAEDPLGRHLALVGAAEGGRDDALAAQALGDRGGDHPVELGERLVDRAVDVLPVVGLRRGEEDADLVEVLALPRARSRAHDRSGSEPRR